MKACSVHGIMAAVECANVKWYDAQKFNLSEVHLRK